MANERADPDERFTIEGDPKDALRGLLQGEREAKTAEKEPARVDTCPDCLGDGFSKERGADALDECKTCQGTGKVEAGKGIGRPRVE
jgi:DnaJ-class molecular chaperone